MKPKTKNVGSQRLLGFLHSWGLALLMLSLMLVMGFWFVGRVQDPDVMPVRYVKVEGEVRHLDLRQLEEVVYRAVDGGFFSVALGQVRDRVERLPWVDSVSIRREWPDTLQVQVIEQQPLARWGEAALVNLRGEIFQPDQLPEIPGLATLEGDARDSVTISREYRKIAALLQTVGLELARVRVDARQAWTLWTQDGLEVNLGRKQLMPRLSRFVRLYPKLSGEVEARLQGVDLRYTNGFTASWEALPELHSKGADPAVEGAAGRLAGI